MIHKVYVETYSRLYLMYNITYDLVAIPAVDYLIPNTRQSRHNHLNSSQSLNLGGLRGTTDDVAIIPFYPSLSSSALRESPNPIPVHSLMLSSTPPPTSLQANHNTQRLLQDHIRLPHHSPLERSPVLHPCFTYYGTIQSIPFWFWGQDVGSDCIWSLFIFLLCCVPSSTRLTIDIRSAFTF